MPNHTSATLVLKSLSLGVSVAERISIHKKTSPFWYHAECRAEIRADERGGDGAGMGPGAK